MESDYIQVTMSVFRDDAIKETQQKDESFYQLINNCTLSSTFEDILRTYEILKPVYEIYPHSLCYIWSLVIIRLSDGFQSSDKGIEFFNWVKLFIAWKTQYSALIWSNYSHSLINEIISWPESLLDWAQLLLSYKHVPELNYVFKVLKSHLIKEFWTNYKKIYEEFSIETVSLFLNILKLLKEVDGQQFETVDFAIDTILKNLIEFYDIDGVQNALTPQPGKDLGLGKQILHLIDKYFLILNDSNSKLYKKVKEKLGIKHKHPFIPDPSNTSNTNLVNFQCEEQPFYSKKCSEFTVAAYRAIGTTATQEQKRLVVKVYSYYTPRFFEKINQEISILTFLSNRRNENQMFLEFYDSQLKDKECYLFMEDGGMSLMDFISERKASKNFLSSVLIEKWIQDLVLTFAWLSNYCIYHRDIKPHNILVSGNEGNLKLKIIDFNVSLRTQDVEYTVDKAKSIPIQGTFGYMAPELEAAFCKGETEVHHKPGKADVFSLGITILQTITFENYNGFNKEELNDKLLEKVENLNSEYWVKILLRLMLEKNYKKRISFRKSVSMLPGAGTLIIS